AGAVAAEISFLVRDGRVGLSGVSGVGDVAGEAPCRVGALQERIVGSARRVQIEAPDVVAAGEAADAAGVGVPLEVDARARLDVLVRAGCVDRAAAAEPDAGPVPLHEGRGAEVAGRQRRNIFQRRAALVGV